ncbi:MAG: hypothetical protein J6T47_01800 [Lachnospiraceae bacterium]|nr:hypothetical protein [Lachnospiraceae bacterium]
MNLDYTKHQQKIEMVHKKLVDEEEEYANAVKAHEKQGHNVLMCTIAIVVLLVVTALFRMMDDSMDTDMVKRVGETGPSEMILIGYGLSSVAKYLMYAGIVALAVIIILNLRKRLYYTDPVSRDQQSYTQYVLLQEEVIRKLRAEEKKLAEEAAAMERTAKQNAMSDDRKTIGQAAAENVFSENGVMDGVRETDGELVLSVEDAWNSIQEEATYESEQK